MLAQQASPADQATPTTTQPGTTASPQQTTPDATQGGNTASPQQPSSAPAQGSAEQRQEQEDKASQDLLNGSRETGTQLPESPDTTRAKQEAAEKAAQEQEPSEPTGTAAAPAGTISGSTASRPAGAAIAPAKQRQVRSFVIKLGLIAGAGVALGTVYALSRGSSSTPPGAR